MNYESIIAEKRDGIMSITLNKPDILNAIGAVMLEELGMVIEETDKDDDIKVLVLTGAGRAFSAGADLATVSGIVRPNLGIADPVEMNRRVRLKPLALYGDIALKLRNLEKPTIAALNGMATGVGLSYAMACDIKIASEKAKFSFPFVKLGGIPDGGATFYLPRLIGSSRALELIYTGDTIDAREAERIGLVNRVVPHENLLTNVMELAARIAKGPSMAIELMKGALYHGLESNNFAHHLGYETWAQERCFETEDIKEGVTAFFEKREPKFKGK